MTVNMIQKVEHCPNCNKPMKICMIEGENLGIYMCTLCLYISQETFEWIIKQTRRSKVEVMSIQEIRDIIIKTDYEKEDYDVMGCVQNRTIGILDAIDLLATALNKELKRREEGEIK